LQLTQQFVLAAVKPVQAGEGKIAPRAQPEFCNIMVFNSLTSKYLDYVSLTTQRLAFDAHSSVKCNYYSDVYGSILSITFFRLSHNCTLLQILQLAGTFWRRRLIQILTKAFSVYKMNERPKITRQVLIVCLLFGKDRIHTQEWFVRIFRFNAVIQMFVRSERGRAFFYKSVTNNS
jgi:hypothetical protein